MTEIRSTDSPLDQLKYAVRRGASDDELTQLAAEVTGSKRVKPYLDHVGIVVSDLARAVRVLGTSLQAELIAGGVERQSQVMSAYLTYPGGGKLELLQPLGDGPLRDFLDRRGEGVHHLTVMVGDIPQTVGDLEAAGIALTGLDVSDPHWQEVYFKPREAHGCLIQVVAVPEDYDVRTPGITLEEILNGSWEWRYRRPVRVQAAEDGGQA